jgi:proteasome lid subunit RPN8/RPN11
VGGFAISAADDLLCVEDVELVRQRCTLASVAFDDESVAEFFDQQVDAGRKPEQFARIWVHTHPGSSAEPSSVDEETFRRVFGRCDWAVLFIVSQTGQTYCRIRFRTGPGGSFRIPIEVDYEGPFRGTDWEAWKGEYLASVMPIAWDSCDLATPGGSTDGFSMPAPNNHRPDDFEVFELKESCYA